MASRAARATADAGGVVGRAVLVSAVTPGAVAWAASSGQLRRVLPRTGATAAALAQWDGRARAALEYAGPGAVLSHLSALRVWGLLCSEDGPEDGPVHVLVPHQRRPRAAGSDAGRLVHVHRSRRPFDVRLRSGLPAVRLERVVVESWPLLQGAAQRAPALVAVRRRLTTAQRLRDEATAHPRLHGGGRLLELLGLLERGCHSELELWGHTSVFTGSRFASLQRQVRRRVRDRTVHLDAFDPAGALAVELDGREHHDSARDRERDIERDALVAELGIMTVRYSHRSLTTDPAGCREQAWRLIRVRRQQLAGCAHPTGDALGSA